MMISLYAKTWWHLIRFDVLLLTRGFASLYYKVRTHPQHKPVLWRTGVEQIVAAFELACIWYPKHVRCLQRSAALTCLLRNYAIPAHMVIGTQKFPFKAHAWVEIDGRVVS